eukprot:10234332-Ditylum_brightwellii.AAC.1
MQQTILHPMTPSIAPDCNKPHIILPDQPTLLPPRILLMFIPTPKGWKRYNILHQPAIPHIIPLDVHQLNHVVIIKSHTTTR